MMIHDKPWKLADALSRLEKQLESPVIPGELGVWWEAVVASANVLEPALRRQVEVRHRELLDEMIEQDDGMLSRVERLRAEDQAILCETVRFCQTLPENAESDNGAEPDERLRAVVVNRTVDEGLSLIIRIRKQEVAIDTWYMEAFKRDRGVVD